MRERPVLSTLIIFCLYSLALCLDCNKVVLFIDMFPFNSSLQDLPIVAKLFAPSVRGLEQGGKSPFSLLSESISPSSLLFGPISPSSLNASFSFPPSSLLFPSISPSSQLYLCNFSLLPILFLPHLL